VGAGRGAHRSGHAFYTQSVLSTLSDAEPELAQAIARRLPDGQDLFSSLDQGVTPRGSGVPTGMNPQLLEPDEIERNSEYSRAGTATSGVSGERS
jgi:hypothetical protein